jgi:hypothetical protein
MNNIEDYFIEYLFRGVLESFFILIFIWSIIKYTDLLKIIKNNRYKKVILTIFIILISAQIVDRYQYQFPQKYDFYPFIRFAMYQAAPEGVELTSYRICGYKKDIICEEVNIAKIYNTISLPSLSSRMHYLMQNHINNSEEIVSWLKAISNEIDESEILYFTFEKKEINNLRNNSNQYFYTELARYFVHENA